MAVRSLKKTRTQARPGGDALVLGAPLMANALVAQFAALGWRAQVPDSALTLRAQLTAFRDKSGPGGLVHPGIADWAEKPELLAVAKELGLEVLAPSERILSLFGNKLSLLIEAERCQIPHLLLTKDPFQSVHEVRQWLDQNPVRMPLVLKGLWTGGSQWIRVLRDKEQLEVEIPHWIEEQGHRAGQPLFLLEKYLEGARQVLVPFVRFHDGTIQFFPRVDTTIQSKGVRLLSVCPQTFLDQQLESKILVWTRNLADRCGYVGMGSLYYLVDGDRAFLVDGASRVTLDTPLWERAAGVSALEWQLRAHQGESEGGGGDWGGKVTRTVACARWSAQDSWAHLPQPGVIEEFEIPAGDRAEVQTPLSAGDEIHWNGFALLGLVFAEGRNRLDAFKDLHARLKRIRISGTLQTNLRYLLGILDQPWVREGMVHAGYLDEDYVPSWPARDELHSRRLAPRSSALHAQCSGRVHSVRARVGTPVAAGHALILIESLGELIPHALPLEARVVRWEVAAGDLVKAGQALATLEIPVVSSKNAQLPKKD